jgi:hypothetical protein
MASPFLAKSGCCGGLGGCPDLRRFADHSGGTVADSHGLPRSPNLLNIESKSMLRDVWCQLNAKLKFGHVREKSRWSASSVQWTSSIHQRPSVRISVKRAR